MKKTLMRINILLISISLAACAANHEINIHKIDSDLKRDSKSGKINEVILKYNLQGADPNADYAIGPEDLLEIDVFQVEELKRKVRVSSRGYIGLPLIGQIQTKSLTTSQLEQAITKRLEKYIEDPIVSVYVAEFRSQKIAVIGAVSSPQVYSVSGQRYLLNMLSMAGGLTKEAGNICYVLRPINAEKQDLSKSETIVIDLIELLEKGNVALNIAVFNGDVINVPKGGMFFVDGAVNKAGAYQLPSKENTVIQAIAMASGLKYEAKASDIKIFRDIGEGEREIITVDYDAIKSGEKDDVKIKENDIIIVPESGVKNFLSGFMNTIRGLVSFGFGKAL
jgi:polysaccharide export outer membrane protein